MKKKILILFGVTLTFTLINITFLKTSFSNNSIVSLTKKVAQAWEFNYLNDGEEKCPVYWYDVSMPCPWPYITSVETTCPSTPISNSCSGEVSCP